MINKIRVKVMMTKDLLEIKKDKATLATLFIFPVLFSTILPLVILVGGVRNPIINSIGGVTSFINHIQLYIFPKGLNPGSESLYAILMIFFLPLFLLIPIMVSTVLASSSFVGEKENKTIEGLLYTPLTNKELVLAKILAAGFPSIILTWLSLILYGILLNSIGYLVFGKIIFPTLDWLLMGAIISPLLTFLSITLVVTVSQQAKTTKSAQSVAMILLLPILGIVISQASGLLLINMYLECLFAGVLFILDLILLNTVAKKMNREEFILNS